MKEIKKTAIIGMGALGLLYGSRIIENLGEDSVCFVADGDRVRRYRESSFTVNGQEKQFALVEAGAAEPADLVIVAVKYNALPAALETMERCIGRDTTIISVMNGINSEEIIGKRYGEGKVLFSIAQGMDAMKFGFALTYTQFGELRIGVQAPEQNGRLAALTRFFDKAKVPYVAEDDIRTRMWGKFMLNVGVNQTCTAFESDYAGVLAPGKAHDTMVSAMREVIALAELEGVHLTEEDLSYYVGLLRLLAPDGVPSMRQDSISHRKTEVEMFSGTVRKMAAAHGLDVPVNDWLYKRIKELEADF